MFIIDAQLPPLLVFWLQRRGLEAQHVGEWTGRMDTSDEDIWNRARHPGLIIVTKDEDFAIRARLRGAPPVILQIDLGNCSNRALLQYLDGCWPLIAESLAVPDVSLITVAQHAIGLARFPEP